MPKARRVDVPFDPDGLDAVAVCEVTAGTPDRGADFQCAGGYPGDAPRVDILSIIDAEGHELTLAIEQRDLTSIEERALCEAHEAERDAEAIAADHASDEERDRLWDIDNHLAQFA